MLINEYILLLKIVVGDAFNNVDHWLVKWFHEVGSLEEIISKMIKCNLMFMSKGICL